MSNPLHSRKLKGIIDRCLALVGLVVTFPFFLTVAVILRARGEDVFFIHDRVGLNLETFRMYKFTTMEKGSEKHGTITTSNDLRVTTLGRFLRLSKLNEVPQLVNVLRGEMSFVGPRPLAGAEVEQYYPHEVAHKIYSVKPGITGCGSMEFSNEEEDLSEIDDYEEYFAKEIMPKKAKLELWYVDHWSVILDIEIFFKTIFKLLKIFVKYPIIYLVRRKRWPGKIKTY
jgi:lipopolysaccharide/colanic/teichoic acid biosynthesis glycosyltransferase